MSGRALKLLRLNRHRHVRAIGQPVDEQAKKAEPPTRSRPSNTVSFAKSAYRLLASRHQTAVTLSNVAAQILESVLGAVAVITILALPRDRRPARLLRVLLRQGLGAMAAVHLAAGSTARLFKVARVMNIAFRAEMKCREPMTTNTVLVGFYEAGDFFRIQREIANGAPLRLPLQHRLAGLAFLRTGETVKAAEQFRRLAEQEPENHLAHRLLGRAHAVGGDAEAAKRSFERSVALTPRSVMAYHNSAARYDPTTYDPDDWELEAAGELLLYDAFAQQIEETISAGNAAASVRAGKELMLCQQRLASRFEVPAELLKAIAEAVPSFEPTSAFRLLPVEWTTQIGHLGMVEAHRKMARVGVVENVQHLLLAPQGKCSNEHFLNYLAKQTCVLRDHGLIDRISAYQRIVGDNFMVVGGTDGRVRPWPMAAAEAQIEWDRQGRPPGFELDADDQAFGRETLLRLGIPKGAWYVGLHVREGGFHGEPDGAVGEHRNADIISYLPAIERVLEAGGYVVRFGDRTMRSLGRRAGFVEYGSSALKSARMDVFLMGSCRFIIGTTSGLTTAAQAFGTPMLLVNCMSNDCQFWPSNVHFTPKHVRDLRQGRLLSWRETYRDPIQGLLVNRLRLRRMGYDVVDNTSHDIDRAVAWKLAQIPFQNVSTSDVSNMDMYRFSMRDNPNVFGNSLPAGSFLEDYPTLIDPD